MTDMDKLIAAVEAGQIADDFMPWIDVYDRTRGLLPYRYQHMPAAYNGSLDAAKRLHDALLPGWAVERIAIWRGHPAHVCIWGTHEERDGKFWHEAKDGRFEATADTPARAWLLAILKAVNAQERKT